MLPTDGCKQSRFFDSIVARSFALEGRDAVFNQHRIVLLCLNIWDIPAPSTARTSRQVTRLEVEGSRHPRHQTPMLVWFGSRSLSTRTHTLPYFVASQRNHTNNEPIRGATLWSVHYYFRTVSLNSARLVFGKVVVDHLSPAASSGS